MKDVDFIEIGTSDFWTIIESADDSMIGFSIDPLQMYLDNLPNKPNVQKCCLAITGKCEDNVACSCIKNPQCPNYILSAFTTINGSLLRSIQNQRIIITRNYLSFLSYLYLSIYICT